MKLKKIAEDFFRKKTSLEDGEEVLRSGMANLQRGMEAVGGTITLTNKRIIFDPHALNFQRDPISIKIEEIEKVSESRTKFLDLVETIDNAMTIKTNDESFSLTVFKRDEWVNDIGNVKAVITGNVNPSKSTEKPNSKPPSNKM